jgi:hypothetical protein
MIAVATKPRWDAAAAGAKLEAALGVIRGLIDRCDPIAADDALDDFEVEFRRAFQQRNVAACRVACAVHMKRFRKLAGRK